MAKNYNLPDMQGHFGSYGGTFVAETLIAALEERNARISEGLAAAQRGQKDLEEAQSKVSDNLKDAKQQAQEIINQAQKRATEIVDEAKDTAREEGDRIKSMATADIEQQVNSAKSELRKEVSLIALAGVEKILGREVNAEAHDAVLKELVAQV